MRRLACVLTAVLVCSAVDAPSPSVWRVSDTGLVGRGKQVYAVQCASCHGRNLQGQPLWRMVDADQPRRAPALDATGPAWLLSDADLVSVVRAGAMPGRGAPSRMPAFGESLPDGDVAAVLGFIKASWPVAMRVTQAGLNPGRDGDLVDAGDWRFPPNCRAVAIRQ